MDKMRELATQIMRFTREPGLTETTIERLTLIRGDQPTMAMPAVYEASLCLIAQGSKRVSLGEHSVVYDASHYLLVSVDLPLVGHVLEASRNTPYLCCKIDLDQTALRRSPYDRASDGPLDRVVALGCLSGRCRSCRRGLPPRTVA